MIKKIVLYVGLFLGMLALMVGALDLVAKIPREAIEQKSVESAEYMQSRGAEYYDTFAGLYASRTDYYADSITLSINYAIDSSDSLRSVMLAKFATDEAFVKQDFIEQVLNEEEAEQEYLRYWHGNLVFIRPLMTFLNIEQIYILNTIVICGLLAAVVIRLFKRGEKVAGVAFLVVMLMVGIFFVPIALEFTWMFILMLAACLVTMKLVWSGKVKYVPIVLFITGILAAYFDFLTTETITLTMPLILAAWLNRKKWKKNQALKFVIKCALLWGGAFVLTWVAKWVIAGVMMDGDMMEMVGEHVLERSVSNPWFDNRITLWLAVLTSNISNVIPFNMGMIGGIIIIFAAVTVALLMKEFRCKKYNKEVVKVLLIIALIPFVRFLIMSNHSYQHAFFTYRALCAPIMASILIVAEMTDLKRIKK